MGESYSVDWGGGASYTEVRACVVFADINGVISSSLLIQSHLDCSAVNVLPSIGSTIGGTVKPCDERSDEYEAVSRCTLTVARSEATS